MYTENKTKLTTNFLMVPSLASSALIAAVLVMSSEETNLLICNLTLPRGGSSLPTVVDISFLCKNKKEIVNMRLNNNSNNWRHSNYSQPLSVVEC